MDDAGSTILLHNGGLRSLTTTAVVLSQTRASQVHLLHLRTTKPSAARRLEYVRRQARHFDIRHVCVLNLPPIPVGPDPVTHLKNDDAALNEPHALLIAVSCAIGQQVGRIVWPCQFNADFDRCARATEQTVLVQSLVQLDHHDPPAIETPLLELSDRQLIELAAHLQVPWDTAWSCLLGGEQPCRVCDGCRNRQAAFKSAAISDSPAPITAQSSP